jgi:hypothetical protein
MDSETAKLKTSIGEMQKRRVMMADGRRYLIYYTFDGEAGKQPSEKSLPEKDAKPEMTEEKNV